MKYLLYTMFLLSAIQSRAQLTFRILPVVSYGISGIDYTTAAKAPSYSYNKEVSYRSTGSLAAGVLAGICGNRAGFTSGIQFVSDGMKFDAYEWSYHGLGGGNANFSDYYSGKIKFAHIVVPAIFCLRVHLDSAITFVPGLGLETSFNLRSRSHEGNTYEDKPEIILSGADFAKYYAPVTASFMLQANIEVTLSKSCFFYAGLSYRYMISDFLRSPDATGHMYGFYGTLGFGFNMSQQKQMTTKRKVNPINDDY